jgi:hypothetical protein
MPRTLKVGDTADPITGTAKVTNPSTGQLVRADLTIYEKVEISFKIPGALDGVGGQVVVLEQDGEETDPADGLPVNRGKWRYDQTDTDVDTSGGYKVELKGTLSNGKVIHWPNTAAANEALTIDPNIDLPAA